MEIIARIKCAQHAKNENNCFIHIDLHLESYLYHILWVLTSVYAHKTSLWEKYFVPLSQTVINNMHIPFSSLLFLILFYINYTDHLLKAMHLKTSTTPSCSGPILTQKLRLNSVPRTAFSHPMPKIDFHYFHRFSQEKMIGHMPSIITSPPDQICEK